MDEEKESGQMASAMQKIDAAWEKRKAAILRSLDEAPLDRLLRRRR